MRTRRREAHLGALHQGADLDPTITQRHPASTPCSNVLIETSHARISVDQSHGPGLPLLFLHGNSASKEVFAAQTNSTLSQKHHLIAIDLPGHGRSSDAYDPEVSYSIPGYADAAIEVLEALNIDQVALVGWSLGGHIALEMMATFPGVVGALITGTSPLGHGIDALQRAYRPHPLAALLAAADLSEEQIVDLARTVVGVDLASSAIPAIQRTDGRARQSMFGGLMRGEYEDELELVETSSIPLAVINGANDPFVDTDYLTSLRYTALWGGACHLLPQTEHAPFLEAAQIFNHLLSRFAADMDARASRIREMPQLVYGG